MMIPVPEMATKAIAPEKNPSKMLKMRNPINPSRTFLQHSI